MQAPSQISPASAPVEGRVVAAAHVAHDVDVAGLRPGLGVENVLQKGTQDPAGLQSEANAMNGATRN